MGVFGYHGFGGDCWYSDVVSKSSRARPIDDSPNDMGVGFDPTMELCHLRLSARGQRDHTMENWTRDSVRHVCRTDGLRCDIP